MDNEKRYRCTFAGRYQLEANRNRTQEYGYNSAVERWPFVADVIDPLEVGETSVDHMGDTWERIA